MGDEAHAPEALQGRGRNLEGTPKRLRQAPGCRNAPATWHAHAKQPHKRTTTLETRLARSFEPN